MPATPDSSAAEFDEFYLASRRRLVLETYALTGDLPASRSAVRDAVVAERHHWRKVGRRADPEDWVRARAWATAQRRHVARLWRREEGLTAEQKKVLDALHQLPDQQRKVLLLTHLAGLSVEEIGRELGESPTRVEQQLVAATRVFRRDTDCSGPDGGTGDGPGDGTGDGPGDGTDGVLGAIESLGPIADAAALAPASAIHRGARRRRVRHAVVGVVSLVALTLLAGLFVTQGSVEEPAIASPKQVPRPVTEKMLLQLPQVQALAPTQTWGLLSTSDNTTGSGINSVCQDARFADPQGRGTFVRRFLAVDTPRRSLVQTVEISRSPQAAAAAYRTILGWFAGCAEARLQLLNAYRVTGVGEEAQLLRLRVPGGVSRTYVVGLARTGSVTVSTVVETLDGLPVDVVAAGNTLTAAVRNVCASDPAGTCPSVLQVAPVLPPPSGETPGTLAVADLPVVGTINRPWVGTRPVPARPNVAATTCDKANFVRSGSPRAATRTFLIPQARLPMRFGIAETYGAFPNPRKARAMVRKISTAMATCEKRDLGARVSSAVAQRKGYRGSEYALWRLDSEINEKTSVGYWMGVVRVRNYVAQVNFTPAGAYDVDQVTFQALVIRARDRLFELPVRGR